MKNYIQAGDTVTLTAPSGGIASGGALLVGAIFGVAAFAAAEGDEVEAATVGVFELAKTAGQAFAQGDKVYFDSTAKTVTSTASGNKLIGAALVAAAGSEEVVRVRLNGVSV